MNTEQRKQQFRDYYYRNLEVNRAKARERATRKRAGLVETPEQRQARLDYHRQWYQDHREEMVAAEQAKRDKKKADQLPDFSKMTLEQIHQYKMIVIAMLAKKNDEEVKYRRDWKRRKFGYGPRKPAAPKPVKVPPVPLTKEEIEIREKLRKERIKAYCQLPEVRLKKKESRRKHYDKIKLRAQTDPAFAVELRKARREAGMKWMSSMKDSDPEKYAQLVSEYKERQRIYRQRKRKTLEYRWRVSEWSRARRLNCPEFKLAQYVRNRANIALRGRTKSNRVLDMIGCTPKELVCHVENQFVDGMFWSNWGTAENCWQLDHVRPLASYDLSDPLQQIEAFNFKNLKPEWSRVNSSKSSEWNGRKWRHTDHPLQEPPAPPQSQ